MKTETIIRAWKDPQFRASLTAEQRSSVPECPAGPAFTELAEGEMEEAVGGSSKAFDDDFHCGNDTQYLTKRTWTRVNVDNLENVFNASVINVRTY